ncbi:thioesterase [Xenorhabdus mauleonii]|uniref:Thioesterase n=1 Tax=Xenorhabdus mauleonii TaxID=351675 RepID=A0A1I3T1I9_9GAMM|nr:hypothetical protein [Xenorhabdus mauleonii]PHM44690.1 thioesterase [Xenorhabdus mauleonii]SFJ64362.1 hypothetical protein SAMN05421680_11297 [Xenorhabdus mauleonii]
MKRVRLTPGLWSYCDPEQTTMTVVIAPLGGGSAYSMSDLAQHKQASGKVHCPILSIGGDRDPWVTPSHLKAWQLLTYSSCQSAIFPGDHFYYRNQLYDIYLCIRQACLNKEVCTDEQ